MTTPTNRGFQPGNKAAVGHSSRSQKLRHAILQAVTETDMQVVTARLIDLAREGSLPAIKLLFDTIGKPTETEPMKGETNNAEDRAATMRRIVEQVRTRREAETAEQPVA